MGLGVMAVVEPWWEPTSFEQKNERKHHSLYYTPPFFCLGRANKEAKEAQTRDSFIFVSFEKNLKQ